MKRLQKKKKGTTVVGRKRKKSDLSHDDDFSHSNNTPIYLNGKEIDIEAITD